jgi:hypothetical protein
MALKKYKNLSIYRKKINQLLKLSFPQEMIQEIDIEWNREVMNAAYVIFQSGTLKGIKGGIHNYTIHIDIPKEIRDLNPYFQQHQNFYFREVNAWVKSEGKRIRIYPRDRNDYLDNEVDLERRAFYFVTVLQIALAWIKLNMNIPEDKVV